MRHRLAPARTALASWRAVVDLMLRGLGPAGLAGLALAVAALACCAAALRWSEAAHESAVALADLHAAQRQAAVARLQAPPPAPADPLADLPVQQVVAGTLPADILKRAERQGLRMNVVEYRSGGRVDGWLRVEALVDAQGRYPAVRRWLAESLAELPHVQLRELSIERSDPDQADLAIRMTLSLFFKAAT